MNAQKKTESLITTTHNSMVSAGPSGLCRFLNVSLFIFILLNRLSIGKSIRYTFRRVKWNSKEARDIAAKHATNIMGAKEQNI